MGDLRRAASLRSLACILGIASSAAIFAGIAVTADAAPRNRSSEKSGSLGERVNANTIAIAARQNVNEILTRSAPAAAPAAGLAASRDQLFQQFLEWEQKRERR